MPRGDRRGPAGWGPMTGRGAGYCAGYQVPGFLNRWVGRFRGRCSFGPRGGGHGWRRACFFGPWGPGYPVSPYAGVPGGYDPGVEAEFLSKEADYLKQELKAIETRLAQLEKDKKESLGASQD